MGGTHERRVEYHIVRLETNGKRSIHPPIGTQIDGAVITHAAPIDFDQLPSSIQELFPEGERAETSGTEQMLRRLAQEGSHPLGPVIRSLIAHDGHVEVAHVAQFTGVPEDYIRGLAVSGVFEVDEKDDTLHSPPLERGPHSPDNT